MGSKSKAPAIPPPPPPTPMPDLDDAAVIAAKRKKQADMQARSGRESTIMTGSTDKLGA